MHRNWMLSNLLWIYPFFLQWLTPNTSPAPSSSHLQVLSSSEPSEILPGEVLRILHHSFWLYLVLLHLQFLSSSEGVSICMYTPAVKALKYHPVLIEVLNCTKRCFSWETSLLATALIVLWCRSTISFPLGLYAALNTPDTFHFVKNLFQCFWPKHSIFVHEYFI